MLIDLAIKVAVVVVKFSVKIFLFLLGLGGGGECLVIRLRKNLTSELLLSNLKRIHIPFLVVVLCFCV